MKALFVCLLLLVSSACIPSRELTPVQKVAYAPVAAAYSVAATPVVVVDLAGVWVPLWVLSGFELLWLAEAAGVMNVYRLFWEPCLSGRGDGAVGIKAEDLEQ